MPGVRRATQMPTRAAKAVLSYCPRCFDEGWVLNEADLVDACPDCTQAARVEFEVTEGNGGLDFC